MPDLRIHRKAKHKMHLTVYVFPADQTGKESDSFVPGTDCPYPWKVSGTWEQCGTNAIIIIVDIVAIIVDRAIVVDIRGVVTIVAGRPQPPSAHGLSIQSDTRTKACYSCDLFLSLFIHAPSVFWQSANRRAICSYCFGRIHPCSIDKSAK